MSEDSWGTILYDASYGGFPIHVMSTSDSAGRTLARHKYPHVDGADLEDMGAEPRVTRCRIIFTGPDHYEAFRVFHDLANSVEPLLFTHPITGSYLAKVGPYNFDADSERRDTITVDCTFEEDTTTPAVFPVGAGSPTLSGADDVAASAAAVSSAVIIVPGDEGTIVDLPDDSLLDDAMAISQSWADDGTKTLRDVTYELNTLTDRIQATMDDLAVSTDLTQYPVMTALLDLSASLRRAAQAFAQVAPQLFQVTVEAPTPLLLIASQLYGAAEAPARLEELLSLNDIRNPARVERGTVLTAQAPSTTAGVRSPA